MRLLTHMRRDCGQKDVKRRILLRGGVVLRREKCGGWQIMKKHGITAVRRIILPEGRGHGLSVQLRAVRNRLYYYHG